MAINTRFDIKQNDLLPDLTGTFQFEDDGAPQDLTGAALEFHMRNPATGVIKVNRAAAIDGDPKLGRFRFSWVSGDTDTPGVYEGEIEATFAGKPLTAPNRRHFKIVVTGEIA